METPMCWTDQADVDQLRFGSCGPTRRHQTQQWKEIMKALDIKSQGATILGPSRLAAFALALTLVLTLFVGTGSLQAGVGGDFAVGGITTFDGHVAFAAQQNAKGAGGYVVQDSFGVHRSGPVKCFTVSGNRATVEWEVKHSDNSGEITQHRTFEVTDNGEPIMGMPTDLFLDRMTNNDCGAMNGGGCYPVHGNIVVRDN
jgi:hypothetical protein